MDKTKHTDILCIIKGLMCPHKVRNGIDQYTPLLDELDRRLAHRDDISLGNSQPNGLVEPLLPNITDDDPSTNIVDDLQGVKPQPAEAKQEHRLGGLDLGASVDGVVCRVHGVGRHGSFGRGHALRNQDQPPDVDGRVGGVVSVLANARVVTVFANLREIARALGAVVASASWDTVESDDIALLVVSSCDGLGKAELEANRCQLTTLKVVSFGTSGPNSAIRPQPSWPKVHFGWNQSACFSRVSRERSLRQTGGHISAVLRIGMTGARCIPPDARILIKTLVPVAFGTGTSSQICLHVSPMSTLYCYKQNTNRLWVPLVLSPSEHGLWALSHCVKLCLVNVSC